MDHFNSDTLWKNTEALKNNRPLVHNITNLVVADFSANALLAIGASPLMAQAKSELRQIISIADALVVNIGTLDEGQIVSMQKAIGHANEKSIPIIIDPVGVGASDFRKSNVKALLESANRAVLKGNASEILSLAGKKSKSRGVDSFDDTTMAVKATKDLFSQYDLAAIGITGMCDFVISPTEMSSHLNGTALMTKVTGIGCILSAITAAFCAVNPDRFQALQAAMTYVGIAGELASEMSNGPASFKVAFIDQLHGLEKTEIEKRIRVELC